MTPQGILAQATAMGKVGTVPTRGIEQRCERGIDLPLGSQTILIDGSWDGSRNAGTAFLCFDHNGKLTYTHTKHITCEDAFHAEAQALVEALQYVQHNGNSPFMICFDCMSLVEATVQENIMDIQSWQAAEIVARAIQLYQHASQNVEIRHVSRTILTQPHSMANWARTTYTSFTGTIPAQVAARTNIQQILNEEHFRHTSQH